MPVLCPTKLGCSARMVGREVFSGQIQVGSSNFECGDRLRIYIYIFVFIYMYILKQMPGTFQPIYSKSNCLVDVISSLKRSFPTKKE